MAEATKGQKCPRFDGKREKFPMWSYTFLSFCNINKCREALTSDTFNVPAETAVLDPATQQAAIARREANSYAYALLTCVVTDPTGHMAIRNGCTTPLPSGSAREAWRNLLRIYQPISTTQKYDLEQKFKDCKLEKETKHPDDWFTELDHIRLLLRTDHQFIITEDQLIQHIIYNIKPKAYDTMIYTLKRDLMYNPQLLTLERLKDEIRQVYGQTSKHKTPETALTAGKFKKKFKGECRICGAKGHKAQDCWDNDKNKSKRPTWYKTQNKETKAKKQQILLFQVQIQLTP
jgi:hypothetical protein